METIFIPFSEKAGYNSELVPYYCGYEECEPGHSWGPGIRDHYLIHYVVSGEGTFTADGQTVHLTKGMGFLIVPGQIARYQAEEGKPWIYLWVGFHGLKAEAFLERAGLGKKNSIVDLSKTSIEQCLRDMVQTKGDIGLRDVKLTGLLYDFMALLMENRGEASPRLGEGSGKELYFHRAAEYIYRNYSRDISIGGIAKYIGIDRKYLHSIFKTYAGQSPQEFLISYRMERACELMKTGGLKVGYISNSVGYNDPFLFSKIFKKFKGSSPTTYMENHP